MALFSSVASAGVDKPTTKTDTCVSADCHASVVDRKFMHGPAAQLKCLDCHDYADAPQHLFRLTKPKRDLCEGCHTLKLNAVVHAPVEDRNCTGCHDPHGSDFRMMLLGDPAPKKLDGSTKVLCFNCHDRGLVDKSFVHGPVALGACVLCHSPHSAPHEKLLVKAPQKLCLDCHSEAAPTGMAARHVHKPMEQGCTTCHDPHASNARYQLHKNVPELCYSCHDGMKNLINNATVQHGPVLGHTGSISTGATGGCVGCHSPHFSQLPKLQKAAQPDLCLNCHNKAVQAKDGRMLPDMAALLRENPDHHGPIREGACTNCHQPHAGQRFGMLLEEYPKEFYAPFDITRYKLCFTCHMPDLVQDRSGTGLTRFRNGDLNLHWLHVNQEKGRTCRACHEVHASKRPSHIREAVPFGPSGWMLEINYEATANGGSCAPGCHNERTYDRNATADMVGSLIPNLTEGQKGTQ